MHFQVIQWENSPLNIMFTMTHAPPVSSSVWICAVIAHYISSHVLYCSVFTIT